MMSVAKPLQRLVSGSVLEITDLKRLCENPICGAKAPSKWRNLVDWISTT